MKLSFPGWRSLASNDVFRRENATGAALSELGSSGGARAPLDPDQTRSQDGKSSCRVAAGSAYDGSLVPCRDGDSQNIHDRGPLVKRWARRLGPARPGR